MLNLYTMRYIQLCKIRAPKIILEKREFISHSNGVLLTWANSKEKFRRRSSPTDKWAVSRK